MKWYKIDANITSDTRIAEIIAKEGHVGVSAYIYILSLCATQWDGEKDKVFVLCLPAFKKYLGLKEIRFKRILNSLQTVFKLSLNSDQTQFKLSLNSDQTQFNVSFTYPKFLKKQASYFRGVASRATGIEQNRTEQNRTTAKPLVLNTDNANKKKKPNPIIEKIFTYFCEQYVIKHGKSYIPNYAKDKAIIKRLLSTMEEIKLAELIFDFFRSNDEFIKKSDYGVGIFSTQINKLNIQKPKVLRGNI